MPIPPRPLVHGPAAPTLVQAFAPAGLPAPAPLLLALAPTLLLAFLPALPGAAGLAAQAPAPAPAAVDAVFAEWDRPGSPGCALAVVENDRIAYEAGYGEANLDWGIPIDPATVFYAGSVSKQFTAAAVLLLAREGELSLDDDVRTWFPELPDYGETITVRHLLTHTSGIGDTYRLMREAGMDVADVTSDAEVVELIASQPALDFAPGERYSYSNGAYFLLSELVERVSGDPLRVFMQDRFFSPLGMDDTHFHDRSAHVVPRRAMSYGREVEDGDTTFVQTYMSNFDKVGAGGLYTTVRDLAKWDREFYDEQVGGEGFFEAMLERGVLDDGTVLPYALGLRHGELDGEPTVGHSGSMMGFKAHLLRLPGERLSALTLCNLGTIDPGELNERVLRLWLETEDGR